MSNENNAVPRAQSEFRRPLLPYSFEDDRLCALGGQPIGFRLDPELLSVEVDADGARWVWAEDYRPTLDRVDGTSLRFDEARTIRHLAWETGLGRGILTQFRDFAGLAEGQRLAFDTLIWIEASTGLLHFEWIPIDETARLVAAVHWPGPMAHDRATDGDYSLLPDGQGYLIPNCWPVTCGRIPFDGRLLTSGAYMPWFAQVRSEAQLTGAAGDGYLAIALDPWDAAYRCEHEGERPGTRLAFRQLPSLGAIGYRRRIVYRFGRDVDYSEICQCYREHARETGLLTTLREKAARNPLVDKLIGSAIVHRSTKTHVAPGSFYYNTEQPERNDQLVPFAEREAEMRELHALGVEKLYLHLDGWAEPGYDNQHPDYWPICEAAGGREGMRALSDTMRELGYMFGIHDQYRDYYYDAPTFDLDFATHEADGTVFEQSRWAGGRQSFLCTTQAPAYVRRNFERLLGEGIHLEAAYLDVFTCNEGDECIHPWHRMTRRESYALRGQCFDYLWSRGILPSSEECCDWAMRNLVFCHYGPYAFMLAKPGTPRPGIPVPLFNLVYHDCMVLPWLMTRIDALSDEHGNALEGEDYMLYALLNGGAAYLDVDGAYPGVDGAFDDAAKRARQRDAVARYEAVAALQTRVAHWPMCRHELIDGDPRRQCSVFCDPETGEEVTVSIDLYDGSYAID